MTPAISLLKPLTAIAAVLVLAGCSLNNAELSEQRDLGTFRLGYNVVSAKNAVKGPLSRNATPEEFESVLTSEIDRRFSRYQGNKLFHLGVSVYGYVLAVPGVPIVAAPRSLMIVGVNVWDDTAGVKLTDEPHQITVFESISPEAVAGSGLTKNAEEQMLNLAQNTSKEIEDWLFENREWFKAKAAQLAEQQAAESEVAVAEAVDLAQEIPSAVPVVSAAPVADSDPGVAPAPEVSDVPAAQDTEARPKPRPLVLRAY